MFIPVGIFFGEGGNPPPKKNLQFPPTAGNLFAVNLFFGRALNYKYITKTFF